MDQLPGPYPSLPGVTPPPSGVAARHPLDLNRVVSLTFSLFRYRWKALVGVSAVILGPALALATVLQAAIGDELARFEQVQLDLESGLPVDLETLLPVNLLLITFGVSLIVIVAGYIADAALVKIVSSTYAGERLSARDALKATAQRLPTLIGIALITMLAIFGIALAAGLGGVVLIVASAVGGQIQPGLGVFVGLILVVAAVMAIIFLSLRWSLAVQVAALERHGALGSLGRSWRLVSGSTLRVLGYTLVFGLLVGVVALVVGALTAFLVGTGFDVVGGRVTFNPLTYVVVSLIGMAMTVALTPITLTGLTLLYFDLRWRHGEPPIEPTAEPLDSVPEEQV